MTLSSYIQSYLGTDIINEVGSGWVTFAVDDTLEAYGVTLEADATDSVKLHAIAKVKAWEGVVRECLMSVDFSADNASFNLSTMYDHAKEMLAQVSLDAAAYLPAYVIEQGTINYPSDPYDRVEILNYTDLDPDIDFGV